MRVRKVEERGVYEHGIRLARRRIHRRERMCEGVIASWRWGFGGRDYGNVRLIRARLE